MSRLTSAPGRSSPRRGLPVRPVIIRARHGRGAWPDAGLRVTARVSLLPVDVRCLARDERADFAAFLATLPPRQWEAPTLCAEWRVHDVVAHVIGYDELDARGLLGCVVRGRLWASRINAVVLERYGLCSPEQLLGC